MRPRRALGGARRGLRAAADRVLRTPPVVYRAATRPAAVALTFDDGPGACTAAIAATLEQHGCRGTFFVLGPAVEADPARVAALAAAGHEIGNHLWSHEDPATLSPATLRAEAARDRGRGARGGRRDAGARPPALLRRAAPRRPRARPAWRAARGRALGRPRRLARGLG